MSEELRLQAVRQFERSNLEYNEELQYMITIASKLCKTPVAFIIFQDRNVELIKIKNDLNIQITTSDLSLCCLGFNRKKGIFVVNDTLNDPRFCYHPSVTGGIKIRFYAATPLVT